MKKARISANAKSLYGKCIHNAGESLELDTTLMKNSCFADSNFIHETYIVT